MASCLANDSENIIEKNVLYETHALEKARERSYLKWPLTSYPPRMDMKEAGWFVVQNQAGQWTAACLYCRKAVTGWKSEHNPLKVHQVISPQCIFISNIRNRSTSSSMIIDALPPAEKVSPSLHPMAELPKRIQSFETWPPMYPIPSVEILINAGLFYTGVNRQVECFFCHHRMSITRADNDLMLAHTDGCKYAEHLKEHSQRLPLDIKASKKTYKLIETIINENIRFYFLRSNVGSTIGILLSALVFLQNQNSSSNSDSVLTRLRPTSQLNEDVHWQVSSDGPLVRILHDLAGNPEDLTHQSTEIQAMIEDSPSTIIELTHNDPNFHCKTCLTIDASPHIIPMKCRHLGLCEKQCFPKWMTCVICGYTLGKTLRIRGV